MMTPHRPLSKNTTPPTIRSSIGLRSNADYVFTDHLIVMPAPHTITQVECANDLCDIARRRSTAAILLVATSAAPLSDELRRFLAHNNIALVQTECANLNAAKQILTADWQQRHTSQRPTAQQQDTAQPT